MPESKHWLAQLRDLIARHAGDDDVGEQVSLGAQDLLDTAPDYEVCEAYSQTSGEVGDPLADLLAAECERRNLDF